jgi:hypothetical protein
LFGTPGFAAPEIHYDPRTATPLSDAYSIGAIVRWFTNISLDQSAPSPAGRYWSELIRNTVVYAPSERWLITEIVRHLAHPVPDRIAVHARYAGADPRFCMRCGAPDDHDGAGRCVHCGFMDEI